VKRDRRLSLHFRRWIISRDRPVWVVLNDLDTDFEIPPNNEIELEADHHRALSNALNIARLLPWALS
jgi:hypothetical protein